MNEVLDNNHSNGSMTFNPEIKSYLSEVAKWAKFMAILGFVMLGLMMLVGLAMGTFMSPMLGEASELTGGLSAGFFMIYFLIVALIYFFPLLYLYRFAKNMQTAIAADDQASLAISFKNLKSCYKFLGILMIIGLALYGVMIIGGIFFGAMANG